MRVVAVTKSVDDPATRYRSLPLEKRLTDIGVEVIAIRQTGGLVAKLKLLMAIRNADWVFVQRRLLPRWLLGMISVPLVYDFDDAVFCKSNGSESVTRRRNFDATISRASLVLAGNAYLAAHCEDKAVVIPTPVDPSRYRQRDTDSEVVRLVWIGSSSTRRYLEQHQAMLESLGRSGIPVTLTVVADFALSLDHLQVRNIAWSPEAEVDELANADIGIAPMTDDAWTRGKCALKILQYMAAALPVIASPVGANKEVVVHSQTGLLAGDDDQWVAALQELGSSPGIRRDLGRRGHTRLLSDYAEAPVLARMMSALASHDLIPRMSVSSG